MNIFANNTTEYLLYLIALSGELSYRRIYNGFSYSKRSKERAVGELIKSNMLKKHKCDDGAYSIRLKWAAGEQALAEASPLLLEHAKTMCVYDTTKKESLKRRFRGENIALLLSLGISVDGITLIKNSNILGKNNNIPQKTPSETRSLLTELSEVIRKNDTLFITSKYVRALLLEHRRMFVDDTVNRTTSSGLLSTPNGIYRVYSIFGNTPGYKRDNEIKAIELEHHLLRILEVENYEKGFGRDALYIYKDEDALFSLYANEKQFRRILYTNIYAVPYNENLGEYLRLICVEDWEDKLKAILAKTEISQDANIYSAINCNISEIREWEFENTKLNKFLIFPWQRKAILSIYGHFIDDPEEQIEEIDDNTFKTVVDFIIKMESR